MHQSYSLNVTCTTVPGKEINRHNQLNASELN
jgi:hypothetical protein